MRGVIVGAALLASFSVPAAAAGCADRLHVVIESGSIRAAARPERIEEPALETLRTAAGAEFKEAAERLCRARKLAPAALKPFRQVVVLQGSGCASPCVWREDGKFGGQAIIFQYIWAESKLAVPPPAEIEAAIACFATNRCEAQN